jgi:hypothetical protein
MTTITIDEKTKEDLLKIAAKLQIEKKEKISYDTAIKFLITTYLTKKDEVMLRNACEKVNGLDINEALEELYSERKKDEISF